MPVSVPAPPTAADLGELLVHAASGDLARLEGADVTLDHATALDVASDEGLWIGTTGDGPRVWLELVGEGESPAAIALGDGNDQAEVGLSQLSAGGSILDLSALQRPNEPFETVRRR